MTSIPMPPSFNNLPPLRLPSDSSVQEAVALLQSLVRQAGLMPGEYSIIDDDLYPKIKAINDGLMAALVEELSGLDILDLCVSLYDRNEQYLGNISRFRHISIPDTLVAGSTAATVGRRRIWRTVAPYPEAIRWLIEICVKVCLPSNARVDEAKLDRLIVMARVILEWDKAWEYIYHEVVPFVVTIRPDFRVEANLSDIAQLVPRSYEKATEFYGVRADREWIDRVSKALNTELTVDEVVDSEPVWRILNGPMEEELGYNMIHWLNYSCGLMESLAQSGEYVKVVERERLGAVLSESLGIDPPRFELLLTDHALSKQTVSAKGLDRLRPAEFAGRDSRLVRRPVVLLEGIESPPICLYGIETLEASTRMFLRDFPAGRLRIPRMSTAGLLNRAIGTIQTNLGHAFRDEIVARCREMGFSALREKDRAGTERIPNDVGFGPVDVFVADNRLHRFVLAEVKDVGDPGMFPRKMAEQKHELGGAVDKVSLQVDWFRAKVEALKSEFGIATEEDYLIEGVVIVNHPRLWMYPDANRLPIVTDGDFFEKLAGGDQFQPRR